MNFYTAAQMSKATGWVNLTDTHRGKEGGHPGRKVQTVSPDVDSSDCVYSRAGDRCGRREEVAWWGPEGREGVLGAGVHSVIVNVSVH